MLTPAQLAQLKAAIDAETDAVIVAARTEGNNSAILAFYNAIVPSFIVWRTDYTPERMRAAILNGVTQLDGLTASKRDSLLWVAGGTLNMSTASARAALDDLTGSQQTLKAALLAGGKRSATKAESLFATGTGSDASPATLTFEGEVTIDEIRAAMAGA